MIVSDSEDIPLHYYKIEIPEIVLELGLSPLELTVYLFLKKVLRSGSSAHTTKALANLINISENTFIKCRDNLSNGVNKLNLPLIRVCMSYNEDGGQGKNIYTILDIWKHNNNLSNKVNHDSN